MRSEIVGKTSSVERRRAVAAPVLAELKIGSDSASTVSSSLAVTVCNVRVTSEATPRLT